MSEHTPGPCKAVSRHNGTVNIESPSGAILGMSAKSDRVTDSEVRANASLWAASPELLEACRKAREQLRYYDEHVTIKNHDKELLAGLDAAIAKAEPKESEVKG